MPKPGPFTYWYLQVPNLILLAMIGLLLVRLVLWPVLRSNPAIGRPLLVVTQPVMATVGAITPRIMPPAGVIICAVIWLMAARMIVFMAAQMLGVRLS